ncbi:MAG: phasin family protein [Pseudomonadota bacterium]
MTTTKKATKNSMASVAAGMPDLAAMTLGSERGVQAMAAAHSHMIGRMARLSRVYADFVERRLEHDRETLMALAECRSPQEAATIWAGFASTAVAQYTETCGTFASLAAEQGEEALSDMREELAAALPPDEGGASHA